MCQTLGMSAAGVRARVRAELTREITDAARRQLASDGAAALSLRAVARELGMASSAVYRYFPSRDDLLTALIIDGYNAVGEAVERADAQAETGDFGGEDAVKIVLKQPAAPRFIARVRKDVRRMVSGWTGEYQYTIDQVLEQMIERCQELGLRLERSVDQTKRDALVLVTVQTMNYLHSGRHRVAL